MSQRARDKYKWSAQGDSQLTTGLLSDDRSHEPVPTGTPVRAAFAWAAQDESQLSVSAGEVVTVDASADTSSGWAYCRNAAGNEGKHVCRR